MKKEKLLLLISLINVMYSCKKESKVNRITHHDTNIVALDNNTVVINRNTLISYNEMKKVKKASNYMEGPMQSFDFSFKDYTFKIRYIEDRAYIQYAIANKIIHGWQFCNANFYYDSSWETVEEDSHLLYNAADSSGILLFPGFIEEYTTYFIYEFNNNMLQYVNVVTLNTALPADIWTNSHEFRAIRKNNKIQISLLDKDRKEYVFENEEIDSGNKPENPNISKDLILLNTAYGDIK